MTTPSDQPSARTSDHAAHSHIHHPTDLIGQIMEFRTHYLKAVARAAVDPLFRHILTRTGDFRRIKVEPLDVLKYAYQYKCPWDLTLRLRDDPHNGPRVNAVNGTVMTRPYRGESITIYIPARPNWAGITSADLTNALAAYYHENPWFLCNKRPAPIAPVDAPKAKRDLEIALKAINGDKQPLEQFLNARKHAERVLKEIAQDEKLHEKFRLAEGDLDQALTAIKGDAGLDAKLGAIGAPEGVRAAIAGDADLHAELLTAKGDLNATLAAIADDEDRHAQDHEIDTNPDRDGEAFGGASSNWYNVAELREHSAFSYPMLAEAHRSRTANGVPEWSSVDIHRSPTPRFDLGTCLDDFISFAAAMFNVVALSWENKKFLKLLTHPKGPKHTITLLNQWLGYHYPWELELNIKVDGSNYVPSTGKWENQKNPELTLTLPWMTGEGNAGDEIKKNDLNPGVVIMGLVLYNTDGPGYPFTCG